MYIYCPKQKTEIAQIGKIANSKHFLNKLQMFFL